MSDIIPVVALTAGAAVAIFVPLVRAFSKRIEQSGSGSQIDRDVDARLARMEQAIESIAVEIERVSEGQRFTTKLLSEQKGNRLGAPDPPR